MRIVGDDEWEDLDGVTDQDKAIYKLAERLREVEGKNFEDEFKAMAAFCHKLYSKLSIHRRSAAFMSFQIAIKGSKQKHHIPSAKSVNTDDLRDMFRHTTITSAGPRRGSRSPNNRDY